jgi:hypothetical protein
MRIPVKLSAVSDLIVSADSDFIMSIDSDLMLSTIGAKRRRRMDLDRSDRHPSTNAMRRSPGEFQVVRNSRR